MPCSTQLSYALAPRCSNLKNSKNETLSHPEHIEQLKAAQIIMTTVQHLFTKMATSVFVTSHVNALFVMMIDKL